MKKLLLISIILVSSLGLTACGSAATDPDVDKMVSITCEMFWGEEGMAANFDMTKMEEISEIGERIEKKYEGKEDAFGKMMEASYLKQCPDAYKKMQEMEDMADEGMFGE